MITITPTLALIQVYVSAALLKLSTLLGPLSCPISLIGSMYIEVELQFTRLCIQKYMFHIKSQIFYAFNN